MEHTADLLVPFNEKVFEAFDNFNVDAPLLTISAASTEYSCSVIGRVVWKSSLIGVGAQKSLCAIHFTLMDADEVEIGGIAWGKIALKLDEILEKGKIYKFSNVAFVRKSAKNDPDDELTRLTNQSLELRFSTSDPPPELLVHRYFPEIDQSQFRADYEKIDIGQVTSVVGLVTCQFTYKNGRYICLTNGQGCIGIFFEEQKYRELETMKIEARHTVLGVLGVEKVKDFKAKQFGDDIPRALYKTFFDSILMLEPVCQGTRYLVTWRDKLFPRSSMSRVDGSSLTTE